jgi:catechol 2,3-dioxygenase-like lactoylglutathione lyase family enzyme
VQLRSIELIVPHSRDAAAFMIDVWGLANAGLQGHTSYLRGSGPAAYLLALEEGSSPAVRHLTFVCSRPELVALADRASRTALKVTSVKSADPGAGNGILIELPAGERFRFLADSSPASTIAGPDLPLQLTHIVLNSSDAEANARLLEDGLGFRVSDRTRSMIFMRCNLSHHSIALAHAGYTSLNHIAFEMQDIDAVMRGVGRLRDHQRSPAWGPGRHGPGNNVFAYFIAPFGAVVEFSTAVDTVTEDYPTGGPEDWTWPPRRIDRWGISEKDAASLEIAERQFRFGQGPGSATA